MTLYENCWRCFQLMISSLFNHKVLYVGRDRIPGFTSTRSSLDLQKFTMNNLIRISMYLIYKKSRLLQFWYKLNTRRMVKTCPFRFCVFIMVIPRRYVPLSFVTISNRFPWYLRMFPLVFLRSRRVFLLFPLSVSPVSYFIFCD